MLYDRFRGSLGALSPLSKQLCQSAGIASYSSGEKACLVLNRQSWYSWSLGPTLQSVAGCSCQPEQIA